MAGLSACYAAGWPFFKMSLMSTAAFLPVMLLACELAKRNVPAFQTAPQARAPGNRYQVRILSVGFRDAPYNRAC